MLLDITFCFVLGTLESLRLMHSGYLLTTRKLTHSQHTRNITNRQEMNETNDKRTKVHDAAWLSWSVLCNDTYIMRKQNTGLWCVHQAAVCSL